MQTCVDLSEEDKWVPADRTQRDSGQVRGVEPGGVSPHFTGEVFRREEERVVEGISKSYLHATSWHPRVDRVFIVPFREEVAGQGL